MVQENISLKKLNTFGIEAFARHYTEVTSVQELTELISDNRFKNIPRLVLGGGSNLLLTKNYDGLVIKNNIKGIQLINEDADFYYVKAGAGEVWHDFVMHCVKNNYAGVENLSLIPGCIGASPIQNIGAYGVEVKEVLHELDAFSIEEQKTKRFTNEECLFGYRDSIFKNKEKNKYIITSVTFKLRKSPVYNTKYGAIEKELENMGVKELSIAAINKAVCNIRSSKLPDPAKIGNAGSFFKNPVVNKSKYESLKTLFPEIVAFPTQSDSIKLAAGWLVEQCGWKGKKVGDAGVHTQQALVLVNYGNATGREIYDLSEKILTSVNEKFGIMLEREVNIL